MTKVEEVARAIWDMQREDDEPGHRDGAWERAWPDTKKFYLDAARAAIKAMREPTSAMRTMMGHEFDACRMDFGRMCADGQHVWRAGVDAALSEDKG